MSYYSSVAANSKSRLADKVYTISVITQPSDKLLQSLKLFRANNLNVFANKRSRALVLDEWDPVSTHIMVSRGNEIACSLRLTPSVDSKLPINQHIENLSPIANEKEISRLLVAKKYRQSKVILYAAKGLSMALSNEACPLLVDSLVFKRLGIRQNRYTEIGFERTKYQYFDGRYDLESEVFRLEADDVSRLNTYLDAIWTRFFL